MGNVDIYHSRRINYSECEYWIRDERDAIGTPQEWILKNRSEGLFYARPVSVKSGQENQINNAWMLDRNYVTIETDDDVDKIKRGCIVRYNGEIWIVDSVQSKLHLKESAITIEQHYKYTISLRK